jgi:hypothetical protein
VRPRIKPKRSFELSLPSRETTSSPGPASTSRRRAGRRCTLLRGRGVSLALLLDGHMVADCAAYYRAGDSVMTGDVATEAAHSGAAKAPRSEGRCRCH